MTRFRIALALLASKVLPAPPPPARAIPADLGNVIADDAARLAARRERLAWQAARDALAADLLAEARAARVRSESCPRSHQDGWLERTATLMDCARRIRELRPEGVAP